MTIEAPSNSPTAQLEQALTGLSPEAAYRILKSRLDDTVSTQFEVDSAVHRLEVQSAARKQIAENRASAHKSLTESIYSRSQLKDIPVPKSIIANVLNADSYSVLMGRDDTFKTFISVSMACSLATGTDWFGETVDKCKVLYMAGEGVRKFNDRITSWEIEHEIQVDDSQLHIVDRVPNLYTGVEVDELVSRIRDENYGLVVVDTLNRAAVGADANSSQMNEVLYNIDLLRRAAEATSIQVIAHTDKGGDKGARGFSAIEDDADIVWHSIGNGEGRVKLSNTKMKDGPRHSPLRLEAYSLVPSIVLRQSENVSTESGSMLNMESLDFDAEDSKLKLTQRSFMEVLRTAENMELSKSAIAKALDVKVQYIDNGRQPLKALLDMGAVQLRPGKGRTVLVGMTEKGLDALSRDD